VGAKVILYQTDASIKMLLIILYSFLADLLLQRCLE